MKKLLKIFPLMLLVCCIATICAACNNQDEHNKITADYAKLHNIDESYVSFRCYGEFDRTHVLLFDGMYAQALSSEIADGIVFCHSQVRTFNVYNDGNFYGLQEAFNKGLLTHDNLLTVRDNHKAENKMLYANYENN